MVHPNKEELKASSQAIFLQMAADANAAQLWRYLEAQVKLLDPSRYTMLLCILGLTERKKSWDEINALCNEDFSALVSKALAKERAKNSK